MACEVQACVTLNDFPTNLKGYKVQKLVVKKSVAKSANVLFDNQSMVNNLGLILPAHGGLLNTFFVGLWSSLQYVCLKKIFYMSTLNYDSYYFDLEAII